MLQGLGGLEALGTLEARGITCYEKMPVFEFNIKIFRSMDFDSSVENKNRNFSLNFLSFSNVPLKPFRTFECF